VQQPGTPAYCTQLTAPQLTQALTQADRQQAPHLRDGIIEQLMQRSTSPTHEDILATNRALLREPGTPR
jgi:hypothetical protein